MKKLWKDISNHERYQGVSILLCIFLLMIMFSCEPTAPSVLNPAEKVTARELEAELNLLQAKIDNSLASIERKNALKKFISEQSLIAFESGQINPVGLLTSFGVLLGAGASVDNVRKRKDVRKLEKQIQTSDTSS